MFAAWRLAKATTYGLGTMVFLIIAIEEAWLGEASWSETSLTRLLTGSVGKFAAAALGGLVATWRGEGRRLAAPLVMCLLVTLGITVTAIEGKLEDPAWFRILSAALLVVGILLGRALYRRSSKQA